jgi:hypothetical protein
MNNIQDSATEQAAESKAANKVQDEYCRGVKDTLAELGAPWPVAAHFFRRLTGKELADE